MGTGEAIRPFSKLTDAEVDAGRAALLEAGDSAKASMIKRLGINGNGDWFVIVRVPLVPWHEVAAHVKSDPLLWAASAMWYSVGSFNDTWMPLAAGLLAIADPKGTDAEVQRRIDLYTAAEAKRRAEVEAMRAQNAVNLRAQEQAFKEQKAAEVNFDMSAWLRLPGWARGFYIAALAIDAGESIATALRRAGATGASQNGAAFPYKKWR